MGEQRKECRDCGWRGAVEELDKTADPSSGQTHIFCPDCGGVDIRDLNSDEKGEVSES